MSQQLSQKNESEKQVKNKSVSFSKVVNWHNASQRVQYGLDPVNLKIHRKTY